MSYPLSTFHEAVRSLIGDEGDLATGFDVADVQVSAALRTVVRMGQVPSVRMSSDPGALAAEPVNPDTWGYLVAKAAHVLIGGAQPVTIRTRALSLSSDPAARRDSLTFLESMISEIDARGNVGGLATDTGTKGLFGTMSDLMTYCSMGLPVMWVDLEPTTAPAPVFGL